LDLAWWSEVEVRITHV